MEFRYNAKYKHTDVFEHCFYNIACNIVYSWFGANRTMFVVTTFRITTEVVSAHVLVITDLGGFSTISLSDNQFVFTVLETVLKRTVDT